jgi:hypothetical protein
MIVGLVDTVKKAFSLREDIVPETQVALPPEEQILQETMEILEGQGHKYIEKTRVADILEAFKSNMKNRSRIDSYHVAAAYASIHSTLSTNKKDRIEKAESSKDYYLVNTIVQQFVEDALSPEIGTNRILEASSENDKIQKEIEFLDKEHDFSSLALAISKELILSGDYLLQTKIGLKGLENLHDTVDQSLVIPLSTYKNVVGYLCRDRQGNIFYKDPADFVRFSIGSKRERLDLMKEFDVNSRYQLPEELPDLPRYIRCGESLILPVLPKIKDLELLEALVPATKLSKLSAGTLIGVNVPEGYDIKQAAHAAKEVENIISNKVSVDDKRGELSIEKILASAGKFKVIPLFGGDKGQIDRIDYRSDEPDDLLSSIEDLRRVICQSIGIPYEILFSSDSDNKGEFLRKNSRYLRKLKAIQRAIENGIKQLIFIHLSNKEIDYEKEDVKVDFFNKLVEVDNLDRLEFMDTVIGISDNVTRFINEISEEGGLLEGAINKTKVAEFLQNQFQMVGLQDAIDLDQVASDEDSEEEEGSEEGGLTFD